MATKNFPLGTIFFSGFFIWVLALAMHTGMQTEHEIVDIAFLVSLAILSIRETRIFFLVEELEQKRSLIQYKEDQINKLHLSMSGDLQIINAERVFFNIDGDIVVCAPIDQASYRIIINGDNLKKIKTEYVRS